MKKYKTVEELIKQASKSINVPIHQFDIHHRFNESKGKGKIGTVVEDGVLLRPIENRSDQAPDIEELGVEVKTCAYVWDKKYKKKVSAKERLSITNINFMEDYKINFEESHCFQKINKILYLLYEYELEKLERDFMITKVFYSEFAQLNEIDKKIIIDDYYKILEKIKNGKAHELSEGDTMYLGAAPKGKNSSSVVQQPFSEETAMKRAFVFKNKFMTELFRNTIFKDVKDRESFIKDVSELTNTSVEDILVNKFKKYLGKPVKELVDLFDIDLKNKPKSKFMLIVQKILDVKNIKKVEEFEKANITVKTIKLEKTGVLKESMSFPYISFEDIVAEEYWEQSSVYEMFSTQKFLFVIFKTNEENQVILDQVKLWNMPIQDLEKVKIVWQKFKSILQGELQLKIKNKKVSNNLPKIIENEVSHIRPHGRDSQDVDILPANCKIVVTSSDYSKNIDAYLENHTFTKQCFWLNSKYIKKIIGE